MVKKNLRPIAEVAFIIILALPLVMVAWIGFYSRYVADDFWTAGYLRELGFWEAQRYWYLSWSGRYSFTFLVNLVELWGIGAARWLPILSLAFWVGALYWFWDGVIMLAGLTYSRWIRLGASLLVVYTTLRTSLDWQQIFLWQTGLLTYVVPLLGLTLWSAWFLAQLIRSEAYVPTWRAFLSTAFLFWFLGGFSETSLVFQIVILGLALILFGLLPADYPHRRAGLLLLALGMAGSLAALLCVAMAPGNSVRLGQIGGIRLPNLAELIHQTFYSAKFYFKDLFINSLRPMLCILGIPALLAIGFHPHLKEKPTRRDLILPIGFLISFLLVIIAVYWICFMPAYVAMRVGPPHRSMVVMYYWLSMTLAVEGYVFGLVISRAIQWVTFLSHRTNILRFIRIGVVLAMTILLILGPVQAAQKLWRVRPEYRQFAIDWDARDRMARQAAASGIQNTVLRGVGDLYNLGEESSGHFARYYGLTGTVTFDYSTP
jgi:hypothetical protein